MSNFTVSGEESSGNFSFYLPWKEIYSWNVTVSFCWENKNTFEDYSFNTLGGLNWDRLTLLLSVKIDMSDLKKKSSCFSTSLLFLQNNIYLGIEQKCLFFELYCLVAEKLFFLGKKAKVLFSYFKIFIQCVQWFN